MIFVDFSDYGLDDYYYPVEADELIAIGSGAREMIKKYRPAVCELMLVSWEIELLNRVKESDGFVPDEWFTRALLCIAIREIGRAHV